jgi:hypothetical protein
MRTDVLINECPKSLPTFSPNPLPNRYKYLLDNPCIPLRPTLSAYYHGPSYHSVTEMKGLQMSRMSANTAQDGYDYDKQAWYQNGVYVPCGHPASMHCDCYGKLHAGEKVSA